MNLCRTLLFAPGTERRKMEKAFTLGADAVILDLEDAVAHSQKEQARELVSLILGGPLPLPTFVRVNGVNSPYIYKDLHAVVTAGLAGIMLAKAETREDVRRADWLLGLLEADRGLVPGELELVPFLESPRGIQNAPEIAAACPRVKRLAFGGNDYTTDTGTYYSTTGEELFYARSRLVAAAGAAGIEAPLDTVCPFIKDVTALREDALRARRLGMGGKLVIHPAQIGPANEVFSPTEAEVATARKIVAAFEEAEAGGAGVIQVEGKMIEYPVARRARQILRAAEHFKES
ncbi:MAG: CoA ester lyase [Bacillota bacterium]|jgi:citrate lyase subunit beta/citryl-CoA lyase